MHVGILTMGRLRLKVIEWRVSMIRILQAVNIMDRAGLESMLMNYYRNIDRSQIQFDFLTHRSEEGAYDKEIIALGGRVYHAPRLYPQNYMTYFKYMQDFFKTHPEYKILHAHIDTMSAFPLYAAKKNNIPVRIAHSHTSKLDRDVKYPIKYIAKKLVPYFANEYYACGKMAGEFLFGSRKFQIIHNAIDLNKYRFSKKTREEERHKLGLEDEIVVGHVGRYCYIKNQSFLLDVFKKVLKKKANAKLLLIGKGDDEKALRNKVIELGIADKVLFLLDRPDVEKLYQAMDIFIMPSLFEGVPVVGIEAQANGLPCIVSDKISEEILLTKNISSISLLEGPKQWADVIVNSNFERNETATEELSKKGYNVQAEAKILMNQYQLIFNQLYIEDSRGKTYENSNDRS
jgi:glycosyltransferase involved in cell wall biosynthesis